MSLGSHFTPRFRKAWARVQKAEIEQGSGAARLVFRDEMLKLGHVERVFNLYRINSKITNSAEFFKANPPQEEVVKSSFNRDIILKCRQVGFTTVSALEGLDWALWEPNMKCGIMAHLQLTVTTIFNDIVKYSYNHFLRDWGHLYTPTEKASSKTELAFSDDGLGRPLESSMRVAFDFRGKTVNFLHLSEASRIEEERFLGSLQGVPANGRVRLESTPNGRGGEFYRLWQVWRKLDTLAPYRGYFVPWFAFYPEEPEKWKLPDSAELDSYERTLIEEHGLTEAHIAWRRWCIEANCQGNKELFENEYPTNDVDCFFTGEALVFPSGIIRAQSKYNRPALKTGFLVYSTDGKKLELHEDKDGHTAVWEEPKYGTSYVIGADSSGGIGKDPAAAYVLNQATGKIAARVWGQLEPTEFASELLKVANYYNKAWINPESNNHGHTTIHCLVTSGYRNLYKRRTLDEVTGQQSSKYGFQTTNESKLVITEKLKAACKDGRFLITDSDLITELTTFTQVSSKTGRQVRREAASGCHDDLVMAAALTQEMNEARPVTNQSEPLSANGSDDESVSSIDPDTGFLVA